VEFKFPSAMTNIRYKDGTFVAPARCQFSSVVVKCLVVCFDQCLAGRACYVLFAGAALDKTPSSTHVFVFFLLMTYMRMRLLYIVPG